MGAPELRSEIRRLLAEHAGQPVDQVALFMLLNTVAGGHYEDRYSESDIASALEALLVAGEIVSRPGESGSPSTYHLA